MSGPLRLIYFVTEDWFFCSHFLDRARFAQKAGYVVAVVGCEGIHREKIIKEGFKFYPVSLNRRGVNPISELILIIQIYIIYKTFKPDIVHQIGAKPIIYGTLVTKLVQIKKIVNAPIGLGFVFSSEKVLARLLRPFVKLAYKIFINPKNCKVIFENLEDQVKFIKWGAVNQQDAVLIPGAGVDLEVFQPTQSRRTVLTVTLVARMLQDKGVHEFIAAARILKMKGVLARFVLAGAPDPANPTSISENFLLQCQKDGWIEYLGWQDDVVQLLIQSDVICLPSYREGLPKSLIEACASGLPIVTTDTTGCREVVIDGENGFLVPVKSIAPLATAIQKIIDDPTLRLNMGVNGRKRAELLYCTVKIAESTLQVYKEIS